MKKLFILAVVAVLVCGCTDAEVGKFTSLGDSAKVECWSGDTKIFDGLSSGKVSSERDSDGYFFKDSKTGKFMEVSGNCVITYNP